jgi:hypothetical protein
MKNIGVTVCLMAVVLFMSARQGYGLIEYSDGGTHDITSVISDTVWVDHAAPGMYTTVNLLAGGNIGELSVYQDGRANLLGGTLMRTPWGYDCYGHLYAYDRSQVAMSDGATGDLIAHDSSHLAISGGVVWDDVVAYDNSQVTISGGILKNCLFLTDGSHVILSGGIIERQIYLRKWSTLTIYGSDFVFNGSPIGGSVLELHNLWSYPPWSFLTGVLANGDALDVYLYTPEPAMVLLLGLGGMVLRRKH